MQPEEAVESAIEEFEMTKADLSDVIKTPSGGDISRHVPVNASCASSPKSGHADALR
jgi:hypothetical protein